MSAPDDHVSLSLPFTGSRLIEASAGTGKTHALVLLLLRAVLVEGCEPRELVAVTYTRAAAGELRERTRSALASATRRVADPTAAIPGHLAVAIDTLIGMAMAKDPDLSRAMLARRLRAAEMAIDALWLGTLHGFCQRLLTEFGPVLGVPGVDDEVDAGDVLFGMACADAWRALQADDQVPGAMAARFGTPDIVANLLREIIALPADALVPPVPPEPDQLVRQASDYRIAWDAARAASSEYPALAVLIADRATYRLSAAADGLRDDVLAELASVLPDFFAQPAGSRLIPPLAVRLTASRLQTFQHATLRRQGGSLPEHPLPALLEALHAAEQRWQRDATVALVHRLHADVRSRLSRLGFDQGRTRYDDLIARVSALLEGDTREPLIDRVRSRWRLALIDEFQDTDAAQHAIFAALFGDRLIMVGDPKQAIYRFRGGDVHAYRQAVDTADGVERLGESYRAEAPVVEAINALFDPDRIPGAFVESFIDYLPVHAAYDAARHGELWEGNDRGVAGMRFWPVTPEEGSAWSSKEKATRQVVDQVASAIVALLDDRADGCRTVRDSDERCLAPGDIAVLCQTHRECGEIASALRARGVPVSLGTNPDIEAAAAEDVRRLLAAWRVPNDSRRLRALALSGFHGYTLDQLPDSSQESPLSHAELSAFAEQVQLAAKGKVGLALMQAVRAGASAVSRDAAGESRIVAWLDLVDRLTAWSGSGRGLGELDLALQRWLAGRGEDAGNVRRPDAVDAVQVMTVHASKGLEFGFVFAPFLWSQPDPMARRARQAIPVVRFHDETGRLRADIGSDTFAENARRADGEEHAEAMRKAYVAITRARHRVYLPVAVTRGGWSDSPLARLLPGVDAATAHGLDVAMRSLVARAPRAIAIVESPSGADRHRSAGDDHGGETQWASNPPPTRPPDDFRLLSYSRLVRGLVDIPQDHDQIPLLADTAMQAQEEADWLPRGAAFGTCFHAMMERIDPASPDRSSIAAIAASHGFGGARETAYLEQLVMSTLRAPLPGNVSLRQVAVADRAIEMEFFVPMRQFSASALGEVLASDAAYRRPPERWPASLASLNGYMRGFIDLVYRVDGRYFVLDYKTNDLGRTLASYQADSLRDAIRDHDYDLQYLIYLVALQRLLRNRLGAAYRYDRCVGGAVYLFVRGLESGEGIHHDRPSAELIDALECVLCGALQ